MAIEKTQLAPPFVPWWAEQTQNRRCNVPGKDGPRDGHAKFGSIPPTGMARTFYKGRKKTVKHLLAFFR